MKYKIVYLGIITLTYGLVLSTNIATTYATTINTSSTIVNNTSNNDSNNVVDSGTVGTSNWYIVNHTLYVDNGDLNAFGTNRFIDIPSKTKETINTISFGDNVYAPSDSGLLFSAFPDLKKIDNLKGLNTKNVTNASSMFKGVKLSNTSLNLSSQNMPNWDMSNVTNIDYMFENSNITDLNISGWNLSSLNYPVYYPFDDSKIINLNASNWNLGKNDTNLSSLFYDIPNLVHLNVSDLDLTHVTVMDDTFAKLPNLESIDTTNWTLPANNIDMSNLFTYDTKLTKLDLSKFPISNFSESLEFTGVKQLTISDSTNIKQSLHGLKVNEAGRPIDKDGVPTMNPSKYVFLGYWIKANVGYTNLINETDFEKNHPSGTYNYVNPDKITAIATIKSNKGNITRDVTLDSSDLDSSKDIEVPIGDKDADKTYVTGKLQAKTDLDGNTIYAIIINDPNGAGYVTYKNVNHGGNGGSDNKPETIPVTRLVATLPDNGSVNLYNLDTNKISNRALAQNSDWFSDQQMTKAGITYYRVATNEWVKASDVYVYESQNLVVQTGIKTQMLTNAKGKEVTNRALAADTLWKVDRLAYINGKTYYRVATNEFVPTTDVTVK